MLHSFTFTSDTLSDNLLEGFVVEKDKDPGDIYLYIQNYKIGLVPTEKGLRKVWSFSSTSIDIGDIKSLEGITPFTVETERDCAIYQRYKRKRYDDQGRSGDVLEGCTVEEIKQYSKPDEYKNCSSSSVIPISRSMSWYISPVSKNLILYPRHIV